MGCIEIFPLSFLSLSFPGLIETWDVLKLLADWTSCACFMRLIETWDVLKSYTVQLYTDNTLINRNMGCIEIDLMLLQFHLLLD